MKGELSEQQIIELLKKKDRKMIEEVYELYSPTLLAICMRYFRTRDVALDAMHEGFMKALNSIQSFNSEGSFEGWLKRIVVNHSLDTLKKEKKHQPHETVRQHTPLPQKTHSTATTNNQPTQLTSL